MRERERERERLLEGGGGKEGETEMGWEREREREIELENFIYKDCSLGSVKNLIRETGGRGGGAEKRDSCMFF